MRENVFVPAGMEHTLIDNRFAIIPYRTCFYQKTKFGTVENADFLDSSYKIPGGGWLSSAEDMAHFEAAILNDKLIKSTTRDLMWTPLKPSDGSKNTYGLGWGNVDKDGIRGVGHGGAPAGHQHLFHHFPRAPRRSRGAYQHGRHQSLQSGIRDSEGAAWNGGERAEELRFALLGECYRDSPKPLTPNLKRLKLAA